MVTAPDRAISKYQYQPSGIYNMSRFEPKICGVNCSYYYNGYYNDRLETYIITNYYNYLEEKFWGYNRNNEYVILNKFCNNIYYYAYQKKGMHIYDYNINNKKLRKFIIQNKMANLFVKNIRYFKYAHKKKCIWSPLIFGKIIEYDNVKCLKYAYKHYPSPVCNKRLAILAIHHRSFKCLKYLYLNCINVLYNSMLYEERMDFLSSRENKEITDYIIKKCKLYDMLEETTYFLL